MSLTKLPFDIVWGFYIHHSPKSMKCLHIAWLKRGTTYSKFGDYTTKSGTYLIRSLQDFQWLPQENYTTIISDPWSLVFSKCWVISPCLANFEIDGSLDVLCDPFDVYWPLRPTRILLNTLHLAAVSCRRYAKIWGTIYIYYEGVPLGKMSIDVC